jgi:hypothetical protein
MTSSIALVDGGTGLREIGAASAGRWQVQATAPSLELLVPEQDLAEHAFRLRIGFSQARARAADLPVKRARGERREQMPGL